MDEGGGGHFFRKFVFLRNFGNVLFFFFFAFRAARYSKLWIEEDGVSSFGLWIVQVSGQENFGEFLRK